MAGLEDISPIGMAGLQVGAKAVDGLIDLGVRSLYEALWGDYYRDKEIEQSKRLLDQQVAGQKELQAEQAKHQMAMLGKSDFDSNGNVKAEVLAEIKAEKNEYRDWETDRKSTRLNSSHRSLSRMPSSA